MAVGTSAICGTFKREILAGIHFLTAHTRTGSSAISADAFKIAMFTNSSSIDADTSGYTSGGRPATPTAKADRIDKFPFASDTNATTVGTLSVSRDGPAGQQY